MAPLASEDAESLSSFFLDERAGETGKAVFVSWMGLTPVLQASCG